MFQTPKVFFNQVVKSLLLSFTPNSKKKLFFENIKKNLNYEGILDIAFLSKISVGGKTE